MTMTPVKIGFVLLSNSRDPIPSTRIAALNMFPFLRAANFEPKIVFEPAQGIETPDVSGLAPRLRAEGFRIVFLQKVHGPSVEELAKQLSAWGISTVYGVCDLVNEEMVELTDATITVTEYLKSLYPSALQQKIIVVHDGIEHPEICKTNWGTERGSRRKPLRAVLVTSATLDRLPVLGSPPDWLHITIVGHFPPSDQILHRFHAARWTLAKQRDFSKRLAYLRFLTNPLIRRVKWDPVGVYNALQQADIGIIPIETNSEHTALGQPESWKTKSENRLTMKMCVGLPVIATPIPSYERVIEQGKNGFLARTREDWMAYFEALRDPSLRQAVGEQARASVLQPYSIQEQARRLIAVLRGLTSS